MAHLLFNAGNPVSLIAKFLRAVPGVGHGPVSAGHRSMATTDRYYLRLSMAACTVRPPMPDSYADVLKRIRLPWEV